VPVIWIPSLLRRFTDEQDQIRVEGCTIREAVDSLEAQYPGIRERLCETDRLKPGLAISVDGEISLEGLGQPVGCDSEIHFVAAISGGK
jgi:molybdopterin synthase sulfur carrier subunit